MSKQELLHFLGQGAENLGVRIYDARYHSFRAGMLKQFVSMAYLPTPEINGDEMVVNLANGTFVVRPSCQFLKGYDSKDFLTYQLPFELDAIQEAPLFRQYLDKVLPDKNLQMIVAEFIWYVFVRHSNLKLEKSLILLNWGKRQERFL